MWGGGWGVADPHVSPQFQQPSKVIHVRNLPFDVTIEEIRELCAPWGTVVAVKDKVGGMKNQAFVEFADLSQAMAMVAHYQQSAEQALVRGRPTWPSFSGRDKLTNVQPTTDSPTPVLRAEINNISPELVPLITLETLHAVFSAYGFVQQLVIYAKPEGGLLAWAQFPDATTAASVRTMLVGQPLPPHLLGEHPAPPIMELAYSAFLDLNIKVQSTCARDFTSATLPWGEPDWASIQALVGGPEGGTNVVSATVDNPPFPVTLDAIHTVFSTYGFVQKIHIYDRPGKTTALVQYPDARTADVARAALQGHALYDGGHCVLFVTHSKYTDLKIRPSDRSRDYTVPQRPGGLLPPGSFAAGPPKGMPPAGGPPPYHPSYPAGGPPMAGPGPAGPPGPGGPAGSGQFGAPPAGGPPAAAGPFNVSGEDYVRQHEAVVQQFGGRGGPPPPHAAQAPPPGAPPAGYAPQPPAAQQQPAAGYYPPPGAPAYGAQPPPYGALPGAPPPAWGYGQPQQAPPQYGHAGGAYPPAPGAGYRY